MNEQERREQVKRALELANKKKASMAATRRAVAAGELPFRQAARRPTSPTVTVHDALLWWPRWGPHRAGTLLAAVGVSPYRPLERLTEHQIELIAAVVDDGAPVPFDA
jgi:hypothetical protein